MEDIVVIDTKDYAQVVFDDVHENYSENQPIECWFNLNELLKADTSDWIGIFKVGFVNCKDFVCRQYIDLEFVSENKGKIVFEGENLPKDDGEFYQFVYVSQSKQIRGASIPFQFKKAHLSDYIEIEEQEAIIYKSKESAINDTLTEIKSRCNHLAQANDTYERLIKENEDIIKCLKEEVSSVKLRCLRLTIDNEKMNNALKSKADNLKNLADTISNLTNENNKLQDKFESLTTENRNLLDSLQIRIEQIENLKNELETVKMSKEQFENILNIKEDELNQLKKDKDELNRIAEDLQKINDQIVKLEKQVDERVEELTKIKNELKRNEAIVLEQTQTIQKILQERDNLNNLIQKLVKEKSDLVCNQENLSQELSMSRDKLLAAEQCKEMLRAQLVVITDELNEANSKLSKQISTISELQQKEKQFDEEKRLLHDQLQQQKTEYELKLEESNGSYFALKLAHTHLESRLKNMETYKIKTDKDMELLKNQFEKIKEENEDLKERIKAGAKEYSKLFERYRLIKNQQFNYDMNIYHDLNGNVLLRNRLNSGETRLANRYDSSTSSSEHHFESDSAIQDKTMSQSARASTDDVDNTLLDALMGSGMYNNWRNEMNFNNLQKELSTSTQLSKNNQNSQIIQMPVVVSSSSSASSSSEIKTQIPAIVVRPSDNLSDDGLTTPSSEANGQTSQDTNMLDSTLNQLRIDLKNKPSSSAHAGEQSGFCETCNYIFPSNATIHDIEKHYDLHYGPQCPICFVRFSKGYPQSEFENHVNNHFSN